MSRKSMGLCIWLASIAVVVILMSGRWQALKDRLANNVLQVTITHLGAPGTAPDSCSFITKTHTVSPGLTQPDPQSLLLNTSIDERYVTSQARANLWLGQQKYDVHFLEQVQASHPNDPLLALVVLDVLQQQNTISPNSLPHWWIWKGSPFLTRAQCWLISGDLEKASQNLNMFLQSVKEQPSTEDMRHVAQFYIGLHAYCYHRPDCAPISSRVSQNVFDFFDGVAQSTIGDTKSAALFYLGQVYSSEGLLDQAIASYRQAVAGSPDSLAYRVHLGSSLGAVRQFEAARIELSKAVQIAHLDDERSWVAGESGYVELAAGRVQEAINQFETSIRLGTKDNSYRVGLGRAYWEAGRSDDALRTLTEVAQTDPERSEAWMYLGVFRAQLSQWSEAASALSKAVALAPSNVAYRLALANALAKNNREAEAIEEYKVVLGLDPENAEAQQYLQHASQPVNDK